MASRGKVDLDTLHKGIQYALEKQGKSKFGFERTVVSKFKSKRRVGSGNELLIIPELRVLVLTKRHVGSGNEIEKGHVLHCVRAHLKVPGCSLVWNSLLTKKLPMFLSRLSEIN